MIRNTLTEALAVLKELSANGDEQVTLVRLRDGRCCITSPALH